MDLDDQIAAAARRYEEQAYGPRQEGTMLDAVRLEINMAYRQGAADFARVVSVEGLDKDNLTTCEELAQAVQDMFALIESADHNGEGISRGQWEWMEKYRKLTGKGRGGV